MGAALPREHGTNRGYCQHEYRKEKPCRPCVEAHNERRARDARAARARARERKTRAQRKAAP